MRSKLVLVLLVCLIFLIAGCGRKQTTGGDEAGIRQAIEKQLEESRRTGNFINNEVPESWTYRSFEVDKINNQTLARVEVKTDQNYYLLLFDYRFKNGRWEYYYASKEERFSLADIENPYRYWIRRFLYNSAFCFR